MKRRTFLGNVVASLAARVGIPVAAPSAVAPLAAAAVPALPPALPVAPAMPVEPDASTTAYAFDEVAVAGFQFHQGESAWHALAAGQPVSLVREPDNPYDAAAIRVDWQGLKLGYVPRARNGQLANLMDQGVVAQARISGLSSGPDPWDRIQLAIMIGLGASSGAMSPALLAVGLCKVSQGVTAPTGQSAGSVDEREVNSIYPNLTADNLDRARFESVTGSPSRHGESAMPADVGADGILTACAD